MATELITGQGSTDHINSEDIGAYQARTFGTGCYVLHGCECTIVDSNTVRVAEGELLIEGRHVRVKGSEDLTIRSGAAGYKRNDLIVVSYTKDQDNIEDAPLAVVPGTATEGTASDPSHVQGSILDGDVAAEHPLYRVPIDGHPRRPVRRRAGAVDGARRTVHGSVEDALSGRVRVHQLRTNKPRLAVRRHLDGHQGPVPVFQRRDGNRRKQHPHEHVRRDGYPCTRV